MENLKQTKFLEERTNLEKRIADIQKNRTPVSLLLDTVQDPRNLGSIFRIADGARVEHIFLFNTLLNINNRHFRKTARTSYKYLNYSEIELSDIENIAKSKLLIAVEKTNQSKIFSDFKFKTDTVLVLGSEQRGISDEVLALCKDSVDIPMLGINSSLNVATAAGIVLYDCVQKINA